jgi:predicted regulator of amino acid metabolism with ACT domain
MQTKAGRYELNFIPWQWPGCMGDLRGADMGLFKPAWMSDHGEKAVEAVGKIADQDKLKRIAEEAPYGGARRAAVQRITDQTFLAHIVETDNDSGVRSAAVSGLTDQDLLANVARTDNDNGVRAVAVGLLTDQATIANIAMNCSDVVLDVAIERLTEPYAIARVAKNLSYMAFNATSWNADAKGWGTRACKALLQHVTDQGLLADIAKSAGNSTVIKVAIKGIQDTKHLANIAKDGKGDASLEALKKITDQVVLAELVGASRDPWFLSEVIKRINDQSVLAGIARNADHGKELREKAVEALTDQSVLAELANISDLREQAQARQKWLSHYEICKGNHTWELEDAYWTERGDWRDLNEVYRCSMCGETKTQDGGSEKR